MSEYIPFSSFWVWVTSLSKAFSMSIHLHAKFKMSLFFTANLTTLNQIEEKVGSSLQDIGTGDHFLGKIPVVQTIRESMNKWDLLKLRSFCKAKDTVSKTKRLPSDWEKIFTNPSSDKGLTSKYTKNSRN